MTTIPTRLRAMPTFQGMAVPYTTWIDDNGIPDFKINDEKRRVRVIEKRLCAMCGQKLQKLICFIGGPGSLELSQLFIDAGMHPACAEYAWSVCPYIIYGRGHSKAPGKDRDQPVMTLGEIPTTPPERMGMLTTNDYEIVPHAGRIYVRAGLAISIKWRSY